MEKAYIFLADGFEEIEGLTVVDILRRAGVEIQMVSIMGRKELTGSHGIPVVADAVFEEVDFSDGTLFVLPGGMPGTKRLAAHGGLAAFLKEKNAEGKRLAAICAAPSVLGGLGLLEGRRPAIRALRRRLREQRCHLIRSLYAAMSRPAAAWVPQFRLHWHLQSSLQGKKRQMRWQRALFMRYNAGKRKKTLAF